VRAAICIRLQSSEVEYIPSSIHAALMGEHIAIRRIE
jgi:hypothetical protein